MKTSFAKRIDARKKQIRKRLETARENRFSRCTSNPNPVLASNSVKYELADRAQAINYAGVSAMLKLAEHVGLTDAINNHVRLLKSHAPPRTERSLQSVSERFFKKCRLGNDLRISCLLR